MQRRIFFNIVVVLLLGVFISGVLSARIVKRNLLSDTEKNLTTEAGLIRELLGESLINNSSNIDIYVNKLKQITDSRITIVDAMGNVIIDTDREYTEMENHAGRPEIAAALKGEAGSSIRYSSTLKVDFIYVAQPILKGNSIIGAVRMSKPLYEIKNLLNNLYINILIAVLTGIIASSLLGYKMAMNITKPVKEITYTASRISKGQFDRRINLKDRDEIGILADSINDMAAKLNETITSLQDKNIKLESIMSSMINGIIAVDNSEEILFINPVAESLLGITDREVTGKHILQVVRNNSIDNYLKKILMNKEFFSTEVNFDDSNEKILKLYANPIKQNGANDIEGIIITIQDVTELRKLERIRTEFIANVSHELKTPLTSIKGFAETLKSFDFDDRQDAIRFLNIIEDEAERLYRLINDILSLSELEQRKTKALRDKIDIEKAVEEVLSVLKSQSDKKNIRLSVKIREGLDSLSGDGDKFKQMLINLIDNAVKYTPENGKVSIEAYKQSHDADLDKLIIKVKDNGIGIPKQHIPRLFERFYRVDKARYRSIGGTGLGLAIVKHIVILFNGEIEVTSEVGKGTEFRIILPLK